MPSKQKPEYDKRVITPKINVFNLKSRPLPELPAPVTRVQNLVKEVKDTAPLLQTQEYMEIVNCSPYAKFILAKYCRDKRLNFAYDKKRKIMYIVNGEF